jgi:RNA-directed DNA polymerase
MRSVPAGSFARLSAIPALWRAWQTYARGKGRWPAVARFALDADAHVLALHRALRQGSFAPEPHRQHVVHDPKTRLISAPSLRDRVLHQAVVAEIGATFTCRFIHDNYACLPGRGPQRAVLRYLDWTRRRRWRLSLDVRRYFPSVQHDILLELVFRQLRDRDARALLELLIRRGGDAYRTRLARQVRGGDGEPAAPGTGLPIGSSLSQWAANLYLDGLDHFVKRTLRVRSYLRYMDDMTLFADDAAELAAAGAAIAAWLHEQRRLALSTRPGAVVPAAAPSTYLGYRVSRAGLAPGRTLRRRMRGKLRAASRRGPCPLRQSLASYHALIGLG